jgi:hypothetical protein
MRLTDDELRDVLARAEEIQRTSRHGPQWNAELAAVIAAGEEVGLSRQAVERAIQDRLNLPTTPPEVGTLAWAQSADGKFYVADVLANADDGTRVRFLRGSEHRVAPDQLRPCAFIPGQRVVCNWPWWGPWTCTLVAYDPAKRRVKLSDGWGWTKTFPVSEIWLPPDKANPRSSRARVYATLAGAGAAVGALIGSLITALVMR